MATRSTVAKVNEDGTVTQIYVHFDGYLEGVGAELLENYNTPQAIDALLADGDHSELRGDPVSYRARGESLVAARIFSSQREYVLRCRAEEFNYLYSNGVWRVSKNDLSRFRKYNVKTQPQPPIVPQQPAQGVALLVDHGDAQSYRILCDCGEPTHEATLWMEVDRDLDPMVTVTLYSDLHTSWFSGWTRWKYIWRLLTSGRVEVHQELILKPQAARNFIGVVEAFLAQHDTNKDDT